MTTPFYRIRHLIAVYLPLIWTQEYLDSVWDELWEAWDNEELSLEQLHRLSDELNAAQLRLSLGLEPNTAA